MSMKFVPEALKVPEPEVELITEQHRIAARIKYPIPNPKDWVDDEYDEDYGSS